MRIGIDPIQSLSKLVFSAEQQSVNKNVLERARIPLLCTGRDVERKIIQTIGFYFFIVS